VPRSRKILIVVPIVVILVAASLFAYTYLRPASQNTVKAEISSFTATSQSSRYITEYTIDPNSLPNAIVTDQRGDVWFTLGVRDAVGELVPSNGTVREFVVPGQNSSIVSWGIALDSYGNVWFTDQTCNCIRSLDPSTGVFTVYQVPTPHSIPYGLAVGSSNDVWFTELGAGKLGEISPGGAVTEYSIPSLTSAGSSLIGPAGILVKDGVVWFDEAYASRIASYSGGAFHQIPINEPSPTGIAMDPEGNLWTTLHGGSDILQLDPRNNATEVISTSVIGVEETLPYFIQVDQAGNVWFCEHYGNAIARFSPGNSSLVEYEIPTRVASLGNISGALTMTLDPSGRPWFTEFYSGKIGTVDLGAPLPVAVQVQDLPNSGAVIRLRLTVNGTQPTTLAGSSTSPSVQFSFSPSSGAGSYSSTVVLSDLPPVDFTATISVLTPEVVCSVVSQLG
jgi:virginiamycin B lyase